MMKKIAIIGANGRERMVISRALSYITGFEVAGKTDYSIQANRYGLNGELKACNRQELFMFILSSFSERIIVEQHYDQYISNGSVLHELAIVKALLKTQSANRREPKEQSIMFSGVERVITEYAKRYYDCFVYVDNGLEKDNDVSDELDSSIRDLIFGYENIYRIRKDSILSDMLENISKEIKIVPIISSQKAIKRAQKDCGEAQSAKLSYIKRIK